MIEKSEEMRMIEHLKHIMDNLGQYWNSIQLLLGHVSKPLIVDDRGLANVLAQITTKMREITSDIANLDLTHVLGEIKYIGNRLHNIENAIAHIQEEGFKKKIHIDFSCDGYEMVRKKNIYHEKMDEELNIDPNESIKLLLDTLTTKEANVIVHRLGLFGEKNKTWDKVGEVFNVSRERVRQMYNKAIRKLRHPERADLLKNITHLELRKEITGH